MLAYHTVLLGKAMLTRVPIITSVLSPYVQRRCHQIGIKLKKIVISDQLERPTSATRT